MAKMGGPAPTGGMSSPRPMPNPRLNPGMSAPASAPAGGGLFGSMPMQKRYDMAMDLLKNGMSMAAGSGSPLAAFLGPLAGAAIGGSIENKRAKAVDAQSDEMMVAMGLGNVSPEIEKLGGIVDNPDAPGYLKKLAQARLEEAMKPYMPQKAAKGGGGGGKKGGGGKGHSGKSAGGEKLYGSYEGADGIIRGRTRDGRLMPYTDETGQPAKGKSAGGKTTSTTTSPTVIDGYTIEEIQ